MYSHPDTLAWINHIVGTITKQESFVGTVVGKVGSGKSYACIKLGELLAPLLGVEFNEHNIVFSSQQFLERVQQDLPQGTIIIFEEVGTNFDSRTFQSSQNKALNYALQTMRFKNYVVFMTLPFFGALDRQGRNLTHAVINTGYIDRSKGFSVLYPRMLKHEHYSKDSEPHIRLLRYNTKDSMGNTYGMQAAEMKLRKPDRKLCAKYEAKKREFAARLYETLMKDLPKDPIVDVPGEDEGKPLTEYGRLLRRPELPADEKMLWREAEKLGENVTNEKLGTRLGMSADAVRAMYVRIKRKGYFWPPSMDKRVLAAAEGAPLAPKQVKVLPTKGGEPPKKIPSLTL